MWRDIPFLNKGLDFYDYYIYYNWKIYAASVKVEEAAMSFVMIKIFIQPQANNKFVILSLLPLNPKYYLQE